MSYKNSDPLYFPGSGKFGGSPIKDLHPEDNDEEEGDNGAEEGPSFEQSMRQKYPIFHDRRDTHTGMSGR